MKKVFSIFISLMMVVQSILPGLYFIVNPSVVSAQEASSSSEIAEPISSPEASPSPQPSVSPSIEPTPSPSAEPEPTPQPTPEVTPAPSEELTPNVSPNPPPSEPTIDESPSPSASESPAVEPSPIKGHLSAEILHTNDQNSLQLDLNPTNSVTSAYLTTDKPDYSPTDVAVISGTDFPKEVDLKLIITADNYRFETDIKTDVNGSFTYFYQLDGTYRPLYIVEAQDLNGNILATTSFTDSNPSAKLDQCANGSFSSPTTCTGSAWSNQNLNKSHAHYREDDSVPYRFVLTGLTAGAHSITIEWDTTKNGKHAIDYLTTYNRTETTADPCSGVAGCSLATFTTFAIPDDPNSSVSQVAGDFTLFSGTIAGVSAYTLSGSYSGDSSTRITINFTTTGSTAVLAVGGHIASQIDWGLGMSASGISGSSYHMRLIALDGSGGNQDRSLAAAAILLPPNLTTQVSTSSINQGQSVTDTATLSGNTGAVTGTIDFFVCGPDSTNPDCTTGGTQVGGAVTISSNTATSASFTPTDSGNYCFRAEYTPDVLAEYSPINHTNLTTECFTVVPKGMLIVIKHVEGGSAVSSNWTMHVNTSQTQDVVPSFPGQESPGTSIPLVAGDYQITESGGPPDYTLSYSGDCPFGNVTVVVGQTKTCTLTNTRDTGSVKVNKLADTDGNGTFETTNPQTFTWSLDGTGTNTMGSTVSGVNTGNHTVNESLVSDYHFVGWFNNAGNGSCANPDSTSLPANITVSNNATTEITLCNARDTGTITVNKILNPVNDSGKFDLKIDGVTYAVGVGHSGTTGQIIVLTGSHMVSETGNNTNLSDYTSEIGGECALDGTVTVNKDQNKVCTITNTKKPKLTVTKVVTINNGGTKQVSDFPLFVDGDPVTSGVQNTFSIGDHVVSETSDPDYSATISGNCDPQTGSVTLNAGDVKSCTITNDDNAPSLTLLKTVTIDNGGTAVNTDWTLTATGAGGSPTNLSGTTPVASGSNFKADTYTLAESGGPDGYTASTYSCVKNGGAPVVANSITLGLGDTATCTITNTFVPPVLTITKTNNRLGIDVPPGSDVLYTLTVTLEGSPLTDVVLTDLLPNGFTYRSGSWTATSSIHGPLSIPEPSYASPGVWLLGNMEPGEVITLTLIADIAGNIDLGLYPDLAWAQGTGGSGNVLAIDPQDNDTFVGTEVNVVQAPGGSVFDVARQEFREGEVLGISTELPSTGADSRWVFLAFGLLLSGIASVGVGITLRRKYEYQ